MDSKLEIKLPEDLIRTTILTELARQMPDRDKMIEAVILAALTEKENRYDNETKFGTAMKSMIMGVAKEVFQQWLEGQREVIKEKLLKRLEADKAKVLEKLIDDWASGMGKYSASIHVSLDDKA